MFHRRAFPELDEQAAEKLEFAGWRLAGSSTCDTCGLYITGEVQVHQG